MRNAAALAINDVTQTVFSAEYARSLAAEAQRTGVTVRAHLKVDTGMGRIGFSAVDDLDAAVDEMDEVCRLPGLSVKGIFTHFAAADSNEEADRAYTRRQYELLCEASAGCARAAHKLEVCHCCNSAGTVACRNTTWTWCARASSCTAKTPPPTSRCRALCPPCA